MELEKERGITIKLNTVKLKYKDYILNLIDTPGHVDFSYEVSRSLKACEGALLLIDATSGVEAQTISNLLLALDEDLEIIPVINKIDLENADIKKCLKELEGLGFKKEDVVLTSGKTGEGIDELLEKIIEVIPEPKGDINKPLKALVFDSAFDPFRGVICAVRIFDGKVSLKDEILFMKTHAQYEVVEIYEKTLGFQKVKELKVGDVGFISASIKNIKDIDIGDTITHIKNSSKEALSGYKKLKPMVFSGIYPVDSNDFKTLRDVLEKLSLNDSSLVFEAETSSALGFGFRVGFLGLLHMEIVKERIIREFDLNVIVTAPSVVYTVVLKNKQEILVSTPSDFPDPVEIEEVLEPYIRAEIYSPKEYIGAIMKLCQQKRGIYKDMTYFDEKRVMITYEMPFLEIIFDFFDKLKSATKGYASFEYELIEKRPSKLKKIDILLNDEVVDALGFISHQDFAYQKGRQMVDNLKEVIPRTLFDIPIQAAIGGKIIARSTVKALRKDVLAKCYGGDVSRKKKLLEKQKRGKKRMKQVGSVSLPPEAFLKVLQSDDTN